MTPPIPTEAAKFPDGDGWAVTRDGLAALTRTLDSLGPPSPRSVQDWTLTVPHLRNLIALAELGLKAKVFFAAHSRALRFSVSTHRSVADDFKAATELQRDLDALLESARALGGTE